jgi:hypothetical protein
MASGMSPHHPLRVTLKPGDRLGGSGSGPGRHAGDVGSGSALHGVTSYGGGIDAVTLRRHNVALRNADAIMMREIRKSQTSSVAAVPREP